MQRSTLSAPLAAGLGLLLVGNAAAVENMIGRQSQNEGLPVVPAPGPVRIDGKLDDWDFSGRIWSFADQSVRNRYSAQTAAMWDREALYLAVRWRDPTPMHSTVDPEFNPNDGWKSDSVQMRFATADQNTWLTTWFFVPREQPCLHVAVWKDRNNARAGQEERLLVAPKGGTKLADGAELAYRKDESGEGYVQELRIPWAFLWRTVPDLAPGVVFRLGFEFLWGDPTGNTWPVHRYADNMQPGATSREFFWNAVKSWGDATLLPKGGLEPRRYVSDERRVEGTIPFRFDLPKEAARVTLVVEDERGNRVRNLAGDLLPEEYAVADADTGRTVEIAWDGLDDNGKLVAPGRYRARGLHHKGLGAEYEQCFYNPGTPPWPTTDGRGGWGADHSRPSRVARAGDWMVVAWDFAEGGSGIVGLDAQGAKRWGEKRGARLLAADAAHVYAVPAGWHIEHDVLIRLDARTGAYRAFRRDGKELPFEYPLRDVLGRDDLAPAALTATAEHLVLLLNAAEPKDGRVAPDDAGDRAASSWIAFVDKDTAALARPLLKTARLANLAASDTGTLVGHDGARLLRIDPADGAQAAVAAPGLGTPGALAFDAAGNVLVADVGPDQQAKAFAADGTGPRYACGKRGGRPIRGDFEPQAMAMASAVAADAAGRVWVAEKWDYPRRVSVWNPVDGRLVRDYVGNTGYAGTGCFLHDSDPQLAYVGPVELRLNRADRTWSVSKILWVPDPKVEGERFEVSTGNHAHPQRFAATVAGQAREYLFVPGYRNFQGYVFFMETPKGWQPVSAVTTVGQLSGEVDGKGETIEAPSGAFAGLNPFDAAFWNDANGDGRVQFDECEIVRPEKPRDARSAKLIPIPMGSGWGQRVAPDFTFYVNGMVRYRPVRFTADGAPVFTSASIEKMPVEESGDFVPVPEEDLVLALGWNSQRMAGIDARDGSVRWAYANRYPGVHGSHRAPMPAPGMLIGPLKIVGVAAVSDAVGRVFMLRGNLGQDFLMTTDGLFVGALFQDGRLPGESLPPKEESLVGMPMENFSHGGEPFNGWFGRQADGKIRTTVGFPRQAAMVLAVTGLETVRRFDAGTRDVDAAMLAEADRANQARAQRSAAPKAYAVKRAAAAPTVDGRDADWRDVPSLAIDRVGAPLKGTAKLLYDDTRLYLCFDVRDPSPWRNEGKDHTALFKSGDAVDLQLRTDAARAADAKGRDPVAGDLRVVVAQWNGKPVAVLMRPVDPAAPAALAVDYVSPVAPKHFDRVEVLADAKVAVSKRGDGYTVEASLPLEALGLRPASGLALRGDVGFVSSDASGTINTARTYWSNKDTNLVNDLPQEAWFSPSAWGAIAFE